MSKRLVSILWCIAGLLAAITLLVKFGQNRNNDSTSALSQGDTLLQDLPLKEVSTIKIKTAQDSVSLKRDDEQWSIIERGNYKANFNQLARLLRSMTEVTVAQSKKAGPAFNTRFGMGPESESGYQISFFDNKDKELKSLLVGKSIVEEQARPGAASGKYIRLNDDLESVYVVNEPFYDLTAKPTEWLDRSFIFINGIKDITLAPGKEIAINGWTVSRPNAGSDFTIKKLSNNREPQADKLSLMKTALASPRFADVLTNEQGKALWNENKTNQLTIHTFEGFKYLIDYCPEKVAKKDNEDSLLDGNQFLVKIQVSASLPEKREKKEDESEADSKKADAEFAANQEELKKKLKKEQAVANHYYQMNASDFSALNVGLDVLAKPVVKTEPIAPSICLLYTSPSPRD